VFWRPRLQINTGEVDKWSAKSEERVNTRPVKAQISHGARSRTTH